MEVEDFSPEMEEWFNIHKSINVIHHLDGYSRNHMLTFPITPIFPSFIFPNISIYKHTHKYAYIILNTRENMYLFSQSDLFYLIE